MKSILPTLLLNLLFVCPALAGVEADYRFTGKGMSPKAQEMNAKVFAEGNKVRIDMLVPGSKKKERVSQLVDGGSGKRYSVMHSRKMIMEIPADQVKGDMTQFFTGGESKNLQRARAEGFTVKKLGKETIEGWTCNVYEIAGKAEHDLKTGKVWFAPKLNGFMVRMTGHDRDGSTMGMYATNLKKKKLGAKIFELPAGYKRMNMPNLEQFGQKNMMQEMQEIQKLPASQREAAMKAFQARIKKQAEQIRQQYKH